MIAIALGIAFGVALIPFAYRLVNWLVNLPSRLRPRLALAFWVFVTHPLTWMLVLLLFGQAVGLWFGMPTEHHRPAW